MHFTKPLSRALALALTLTGSSTLAQRPSNTSICDYYTTALLMNNTAANQMTLLTLLVNTAVIGNYTKPNVGISVPGILAPGTYNGTAVNLAPYFTGALLSSNRGGSSGVSINFLDGGGAAPLMMNMPANNTSSNQYLLLTHLYQYFGVLLGCSMQGGSAYPAYSGQASQYQVHKFMDLTYAEVGYFITQVALSGASFGVTQDDLQTVGQALGKLFDYRCSPPTVVVPSQGAQLQSICTDNMTCPLDANATCAAYAQNVTKPSSTMAGMGGMTMSGSMSMSMPMTTATGTATGGGSGSGGSTATGSSPAVVSTGAASENKWSVAAVVGGLAALLL